MVRWYEREGRKRNIKPLTLFFWTFDIFQSMLTRFQKIVSCTNLQPIIKNMFTSCVPRGYWINGGGLVVEHRVAMLVLVVSPSMCHYTVSASTVSTSVHHRCVTTLCQHWLPAVPSCLSSDHVSVVQCLVYRRCARHQDNNSRWIIIHSCRYRLPNRISTVAHSCIWSCTETTSGPCWDHV